jgi:hypothetical protein
MQKGEHAGQYKKIDKHATPKKVEGEHRRLS